MRNIVAVHEIQDPCNMPFDPREYSALKFGHDNIAREFGYKLAETFFQQHSAMLLMNRCVVIPSPYNHLPNAATIMANHFVNKLNNLLVNANGQHVEWSIIHRKVSYVNDYGFMSKENRLKLISNDEFYLNEKFIAGKTLLFIDDVRITGTHEDTLVRILNEQQLDNPKYFLYYAVADAGLPPQIEASINLAGIKSISDFVEMVNTDSNHTIVRPVKFLLGLQDESEVDHALSNIHTHKLNQMYHGALGEGYYTIPGYQTNFQKLVKRVTNV